MNDDARIRVDVPLGKPFVEIETDVIWQAIVLCKGNKHRAARRLDLGIRKVNSALKRLGRLTIASHQQEKGSPDDSHTLPAGGQED